MGGLAMKEWMTRPQYRFENRFGEVIVAKVGAGFVTFAHSDMKWKEYAIDASVTHFDPPEWMEAWSEEEVQFAASVVMAARK
jgi:hypothetical protein